MSERRDFGRLRKRTNGRWQAGYVGPDGAVHYAPVTFERKADAQGWLRDERRIIENDAWTDPKSRSQAKHGPSATLREFAPDWLESHRRRDGEPLKDRTREHYGQLLDRRILPMLGDVPMHTITDDTVTEWRDSLPKTPVANAHAYALLTGILKAAAKKDKRITPPSIPGASKAKTQHRAEPATVDELAVIVEHMTPRYRVAVLLMGWCGLRFGEMAELRRQDVDLRRERIRVRRGVVRVAGERRVTTPKSAAGIRDVAIPPHILPALREHLDTHAQPGPSGLLFPGANGAQVSQSTFTGKPGRRRLIKGRIVNESASGFCKAREAAGRPDLTLHDLRHTSLTMAAHTGATIAELQARGGHSTPTAAMRYQHAAADRDRAIAAAMSKNAGRR